MPANLTYPGVYIAELPSAVRTITGVPTSVAAFVGTAPKGATDRPVHITSWADYEQEFGGLDPVGSPYLSYAVYQFYQNGGSEAEIVRIAGADAAAATITLPGGAVVLTAASPGAWGNTLRARVEALDPDVSTMYNLIVGDTETGVIERYLNVSTDPGDARGLDNVLASSRLVRATSGQDQRPDPHPAPIPPGRGPFDDARSGEPDHEGTWFTSAADGAAGDAPDDDAYLGGQAAKTGIHQLLKTDIFNILNITGPKGQPGAVLSAAAELAVDRRAMLIADPPDAWDSVDAAATGQLPVEGDSARNAAIYFPNIQLPDPKRGGTLQEFAPAGTVAGVWARTDVQRGVWKAPAGTEASLNGVRAPSIPVTDLENGRLNPRGINVLRQFPVTGNVVWGARTLRGADQLADQWKYLPVRRTALFIEESLYRGTQWVVFEPNDEPLWSSIRLNVGAFMNTMFRQGAFQGRTPQEAYLVKCDSENNPQNTIDLGIVNILVGFAPLKPAEFVVINIQQLAGQIQV
jgi:phage tail sheath protein FI